MPSHCVQHSALRAIQVEPNRYAHLYASFLTCEAPKAWEDHDKKAC